MNSLSILSDQQLLQIYIEGNAEAFSVLVKKHKEKIFTSIYLLVKDKYLAEDIFQDTFIKVIDTLKSGKYSEEGKFLPWAMRIAHNLCVDHFRKIKRTPVIKTSGDYDIFETMNFSEPAADDRITKDQANNTIRKLVEKLPDEQREVIIMRHYANLSFKEIAAMTNCSINTALGRMRYGLLNIRRMISENQIVL